MKLRPPCSTVRKRPFFRRRLHQLERFEHAQGGRTLQRAVKTGIDHCCMATAGINARLLTVEEKTAGMEV